MEIWLIAVRTRLRESTLMSLIFIVDKLEETQLQDRLVRSIVNLQNDAEPSIRTNATIFLGKIAIKLKEPVRARVLCPAFQKAMKDNFMHCRVAGLRTSNACVKLLDVTQMASKIIPQASILLLDKSAEVRSLSLTLIESCLEVLRANHEQMSLKARAEGGNSSSSSSASSGGGVGTPLGKASYVDSPSTPSTAKHFGERDHSSSSAAGGATAGSDSAASAWSSWSVLQGISKSIESATIVNSAGAADLPATALPKASSIPASGSDSMIASKASAQLGKSSDNNRSSINKTSYGGNDGVSYEDDGLDFDPDMHDHDHRDAYGRDFNEDGDGAGSDYERSGAQSHSQGGGKGKGKSSGWDDDDLDLGDLDLGDDDDGDNNDTPPPLAAVPNRVPAGMSLPAAVGRAPAVSTSTAPAPSALAHLQKKPVVSAATTSSIGGLGSSSASSATAGAMKAPKQPKVAVKKLSVSKEEENWDDF